ncbi:VOC family protein [Streptomyces sp. RFCAC02]|uniref:VOC family protein n=1 Tax=Streptomyces sp. RFCAC02 TaxID=2499143 RepID=UPI00101FDA25|nr:VOC family protein [Streptomyces sp. RFCAC02]
MAETASPPVPGTHRWVSLMVHDLAASRRFYGALFGWEFDEHAPQLGPYVRALRDGHPVAGLGEIAAGARRVVAWLPYIATNDADDTAARIRDCGGTVAVGPLDVEHVGRLAIAADVGGAAFGVWQGGPRRSGPFTGPHGAPVWNELITPGSTGVGLFYTNVFGYERVPEAADAAPGDRIVLRLDGRAVAGVRSVARGALPHNHGPHWLTYFSVPDVDEAVARAAELGARTVGGPLDSPFGRRAVLTDPEGAPFAVIQSAER